LASNKYENDELFINGDDTCMHLNLEIISQKLAVLDKIRITHSTGVTLPFL